MPTAHGPGGRRNQETLAVAGLGVTMALVFAGLWWLGRGNTFFYDEWDFVTQRRSGGADSLLRSHNGHLYMVTAGLYRLLFATVGLDHYGAFRVLVIVAHLVCGGLLFVYARRRLGALLALVVAVTLLAYGQAWENLIWPFQTGLFVSVAAGLVALLLLDRRTAAGDAGAASALGFGLASFSFGVAVVAGVTAELVMRREWRRLWVVAAPTAAYGLWYRTYGGSPMPLSKAGDIPGFMADVAGAGVGGLVGLASERGKALVLLLAAAVVVTLWRRRAVDRPRVVLVAVTLGAYWGSVALTRATWIPDSAASSRYLYPAAAAVLVLMVEIGKNCRAPAPAVLLLCGFVAVVSWSHADALRKGAAGRRDVSLTVRAELAALELSGQHVDPGFRPDPERMPQLTAGPYLAAVEDLGSPVNVLAELRGGREGPLTKADAVLIGALGVRLEHAPVDAETGCGPGREAIPGPGGDFALPQNGVLIIAESGVVEVRLRRFGPSPSQAFALVEMGSPALLRIPPDRAPDPWQVNLRTAGSTTICRLGGPS